VLFRSVAARCKSLGIEVAGVDFEEPTTGTTNAFYRVDLERELLPVDPFAYEAVLLLDVIEHLGEPEAFLLALRNHSRYLRSDRPAPLVVLSTPNVAFAAVRLNLLLGRFPYAERGVLDITHKRLFTRSTLLAMLRDCGYQIESVRAVPVPFEAVMAGTLGKALGGLANLLAKLAPRLFAFQFLVTCRPLPGVAEVLREAESFIRGDAGIAGSRAVENDRGERGASAGRG